jgi:hypothetical protein
LRVGNTVTCYVTCQHTDGLNPRPCCQSASCYERVNMAAPLLVCSKEDQSFEVSCCFYEQQVSNVMKFAHVCVLSMGTLLLFEELYVRGRNVQESPD